MAKYNIENVYRDINTINDYFSEEKQYGATIQRTNGPIDTYCHYGNTKGKCHNYIQRASSGVIHLLEKLKDMKGLEYEKLAEYAILWLRYKLNQTAPYHETELKDFYTNHIEKNNYYNKKIKDSDNMTYKEIIYKKKDLMNIKEMTKFSYPFYILLFLYNENKTNNLNCTKYLYKAKDFANRFKQFSTDPNNIEDSSYNKILSTISNDYYNLKKKCDNFPSLPELTPQKSSAQSVVDNSVVNPGKGSLESSANGSGQTLGETLEVTSSSSSISNTLIPALSVVSVIPVFLGIAYKYSLFGIDKLFQRQYLRTKLKKVKKKMKLNI
ncbi:CIR protein PIR protein [Plasmodium vinckei petteri]|uniref:CIR protein PIR protein n=1 Tax=Plasmodium vinckei petteri TaxID=138298 RepID=A0A6V7SVE2_PLAVN|nr:CIR protein PIR protein [Plasmodium vinckei petteri]